MNVRIASLNDLDAILDLFESTIRQVNSVDYTDVEIEAWAAGRHNRASWEEKLENQTFYLCIHNDVLIGFSSITTNGYLDFMFVHERFLRQGVASQLLQHIEQKAREQRNETILAHVSKTALPFFSRKGFQIVGKMKSEIRGVVFVSSVMEKNVKDQW